MIVVVSVDFFRADEALRAQVAGAKESVLSHCHR